MFAIDLFILFISTYTMANIYSHYVFLTIYNLTRGEERGYGSCIGEMLKKVLLDNFISMDDYVLLILFWYTLCNFYVS